MRRKDREMGADFALEVIDNSEFGVLGVAQGDEVYTIPLSLVRKDNVLYFHSAPDGRKVRMFEKGKEVSLSFISSVNVPSILSRDEIIDKINEKKFGEVGSKVFTTEFESAHVKGRIYKVEDKKEIIEALILISNKYTPQFTDLAMEFIENSLHRTTVYKILIEEIRGKRKKFDKSGNEMKFGRIE